MYGGYASLDGGYSSAALRALTGHPTDTFGQSQLEGVVAKWDGQGGWRFDVQCRRHQRWELFKRLCLHLQTTLTGDGCGCCTISQSNAQTINPSHTLFDACIIRCICVIALASPT